DFEQPLSDRMLTFPVGLGDAEAAQSRTRCWSSVCPESRLYTIARPATAAGSVNVCRRVAMLCWRHGPEGASMIHKLFLRSLLFAGFVAGHQNVGPEKEASLKAGLATRIDGMKKQAQVMVDSVFSFGELGFQEFETSKYLTGILEKEGFRIERGIAGIPTAFVAAWGQGKPVIALGSDIDDIPQASQKPGVAFHDPMIEGAPGHGEGHNSGMPLNIIAALAVKKVMEREHLQGTIKLWPGVAEEDLGTKAYYVRAGVFHDVDVVLFAHVGDNLRVSVGPATADGLVSVEYNFKGESAHAAGAPWRGRSALDAVELMDVGWNFRRE